MNKKTQNAAEKDKQLAELVSFEINFVKFIAGTSKFELMAIPNAEGYLPSEADKIEIFEKAEERKAKIIYRVLGQDGTVFLFCHDNKKLGIIPSYNEEYAIN